MQPTKSISRPRFLSQTLLLFFWSTLLITCNITDEKTVDQQPTATRVKAVRGIAFIDVDGDSTYIPRVRVTVIDAGKQVVSSNGLPVDTIEVSDGIINLALSDKAKFSKEDPYRYFIKVESANYISNIKPIIITEDVSDYLPVYLAQINPERKNGLSTSNGRITGISGGTLHETTYLKATTYRNGYTLPSSIRIDPGTRFLSNRKPVEISGNQGITYKLMTGIANDSLCNRVFPGGFLMTSGMVSKDRPISPSQPLFMKTAGWFTLSMDANGQEINGFSQPITVTLAVDQSVRHPVTNKPLETGQSIPLWSLDDNSGTWMPNGNAQVKEKTGNNGYLVEFTVDHLSTLSLAGTTNICPYGIVATYLYDPANPSTGFNTGRNSEPPIAYFTRCVDMETMADLPLTTNMVIYDSTRTLNLTNVPNDGNSSYSLVVYDGEEPIGHSSEMTCESVCNGLVRDQPGNCNFTRIIINGPAADLLNNSVAWYKIGACNSINKFNYGGVFKNYDTICNGCTSISSIPAGANLCIMLWFKSPTTQNQITLKFNVLAGNSTIATLTGNGMQLDRSDASVGPNSFNYSREFDNSMGCIQRIITVQIPNDILVALQTWLSEDSGE